jgi:hypothetical protein
MVIIRILLHLPAIDVNIYNKIALFGQPSYITTVLDHDTQLCTSNIST